LKAISLFSGGKDSVQAICLSLKRGMEINCLVSIVPEAEYSKLYHFQNPCLTSLQSKSMNIPLELYRSKEKNEVETLEKAIKDASELYGAEAVITGIIASKYQKEKIDRICKKNNLDHIFPLWMKNPNNILEGLISNKIKAIITRVSAAGLNDQHLGKVIDREIIDTLKKLKAKYRINISGEGGEYETFVTDAPIFSNPIEIDNASVEFDSDGGRGKYIIEKADLGAD